MASPAILLALLAASVLPSLAAEQHSAAQGALNPVRKVVTVLQAMQKKAQEEGQREKELYEKFMCYCKTGQGDLGESVAAAEAKVPAVGSEIEASEGKLSQAQADLRQAQADRGAAKEALADATALREKEGAAFAAEDADYRANIAAIGKAVAALEKGTAGSFLQSPAAGALRRLAAASTDLVEVDRQALLSFLSQGSGYAPQSGEIIGILKQIGDEMSKGLADTRATEAAAVKTYEELTAAKAKEVGVLQATVEAKQTQIGELGVSIAQMKADLSDTAEALLEDRKFLAELGSSCNTKTAEWEERSKTRAEELVALADTIKVLSDDDALELFKKTLPGPSASLVQLQVRTSAVRLSALAAVRAARQVADRQDRAGFDLLALALTGQKALGKGGFEKVLTMIDGMVAFLKREQQDDDSKKEYCGGQLDFSDDKKKALERSVSDKEGAIAATAQGIEALKQEIAALDDGVRALDKSVAEATEQRKAENTEYQDLMASDGAAKEVLGFAKNRLNQFYNPKLYKAPPKLELSAQDRVVASMGGAVPTVPPSGIAGTGVAVLAEVSAHRQRKAAPAPPPETWGAYQSKSEEGSGAIAMIDLLIKDLAKEMAEAETQEKEAQVEYERLMADSADKRTADSKSLTQKGSAKADLEGELEANTEAKAAATSELLATAKYISSLHGECDWLLKYFDARREARDSEVDALGKAKAVLSGADYSLLQTRARGFLGRSAA